MALLFFIMCVKLSAVLIIFPNPWTFLNRANKNTVSLKKYIDEMLQEL